MLEDGSTIVVAGAASDWIAPTALASTVLVGPGEVVAARGMGAVVVVRRGRSPPVTADGDGGAVGRGAVGGGAVGGGAVTSVVVGGTVVVGGGTVVGSDGVVVVTCATAAVGPGTISIVVPATAAASTNARASRGRDGGAHASACATDLLGRPRDGTTGSSPRVSSTSRLTRVGTRGCLLASSRSLAMPRSGAFAHDRGHTVEVGRRTETRTAPSLLSPATLSPRPPRVKRASGRAGAATLGDRRPLDET